MQYCINKYSMWNTFPICKKNCFVFESCSRNEFGGFIHFSCFDITTDWNILYILQYTIFFVKLLRSHKKKSARVDSSFIQNPSSAWFPWRDEDNIVTKVCKDRHRLSNPVLVIVLMPLRQVYSYTNLSLRLYKLLKANIKISSFLQ